MEKKILKETLARFYQISGMPNAEVLAESKATEAQGANILRNGGVENTDEVIDQLRDIDSKEGKFIPVMAYFYAKNPNDASRFKSVFDEYSELVDKKRIQPAQATKKGVMMGDEKFEDFIGFTEYIHGKTNNYTDKSFGSYIELNGDDDEKHEPIWSGNGIEIYDGNDIGKCIKYGRGDLTGMRYSFCIGVPGAGNMWKSYRDSKTSTFYYVVDRNRFKEDGTTDDPLHIVVFDRTEYGVELTDMNNRTGTIDEYGSDESGYIEYLKSKNVPVDEILINKPKTEEEEEEDRMFGQQNTDLRWFMGLSVEEKSKYIGRGHQLTDEQFDFLLK